MKIPSLKILRVYSDQVEQKEFPIPNTLKPARATRSDADLKVTSEKVKSVSLHHVIRSSVCPYAQDLREYEQGFAEARKSGEKIGEGEVREYRKVSWTINYLYFEVSCKISRHHKRFVFEKETESIQLERRIGQALNGSCKVSVSVATFCVPRFGVERRTAILNVLV